MLTILISMAIQAWSENTKNKVFADSMQIYLTYLIVVASFLLYVILFTMMAFLFVEFIQNRDVKKKGFIEYKTVDQSQQNNSDYQNSLTERNPYRLKKSVLVSASPLNEKNPYEMFKERNEKLMKTPINIRVNNNKNGDDLPSKTQKKKNQLSMYLRSGKDQDLSKIHPAVKAPIAKGLLKLNVVKPTFKQNDNHRKFKFSNLAKGQSNDNNNLDSDVSSRQLKQNGLKDVRNYNTKLGNQKQIQEQFEDIDDGI